MKYKGSSKKLIKEECEICGEKNKSVLHIHHILDRVKPNSNNDAMNCAIICANCHNRVHSNEIEIIGVYPATKPPNGRILIFKIGEKINVNNINEPYYSPKPNSMKVYNND